MAQVTLYLPEAVEKQLRIRARRARKSLSAYVVELVSRELRPERRPPGFADLYGSCSGKLTAPGELPLEDRETL